MHAHNQPLVERATVLETLNALMRGELSAVETYRLAMELLGEKAPEALGVCLHSHDHRATRLAEHIALMGGTPLSGRNVWEAFDNLVHGGAEVITPHACFSVLEAGEDQVLTSYRAALDQVDTPGLTLLRGGLLPEQIRTHGLMSSLTRRSGGAA